MTVSKETKKALTTKTSALYLLCVGTNALDEIRLRLTQSLHQLIERRLRHETQNVSNFRKESKRRGVTSARRFCLLSNLCLMLKTLLYYQYLFRKDQTCCVLCENKAHVCQHVCVIISGWRNSAPLRPRTEIKAINAAQDVGSEVMDAERPELAARGASAPVRTSNTPRLGPLPSNH